MRKFITYLSLSLIWILLACDNTPNKIDVNHVNDGNIFYCNDLKIKNKEATKLFKTALKLVKINKYADAKDIFMKANILEPNNVIIMNALANCYCRLNDAKASKKLFEKSISIDSLFVDTYNNYGYALNDQGKYQEAIRILHKGLEITDDYALYVNLAGSYFYLRDCDKAMESMLKARKNSLGKNEKIQQEVLGQFVLMRDSCNYKNDLLRE